MKYQVLPKMTGQIKREVKRFTYITDLINLNELSPEAVKSLRQNSYDVVLKLYKANYPNLDFRKAYPELTPDTVLPILADEEKSTGFFSFIFYFNPNIYNVMVVRGAKGFNREVKEFVLDGYKRSLEARLWLESRKKKRRLGKIDIQGTPMTVYFMDGMKKPAETFEFTEIVGKLVAAAKVRAIDAKKDKELLGYLNNIQKDLGITLSK